ncbi:unnamed protein product [Malus baccata var. baccata]
MMLHSQSYSSMELGQESFQSSIHSRRTFSPSKLRSPHQCPFRARAFLEFNLPNTPNFEKIVNSQAQKQNLRGSRVFVGFKIQCHSKSSVFPTKVSSINGKKKGFGGVLPSILRSIESENDVEKTLNSLGGILNLKEQTVILKEQKNWERVLRVFEWFKAQKDYVPNVIHYNVVLRKLGMAQKWDELRLCWIEMAKRGVLPTNNMYAMLVDVYGKAGLVKEVLLVSGTLDDAANVFGEMMKSGVPMDVISFNTMIFTCGSNGHLSEAETLLSKMEERGISPDTRTYNIFLSLYADMGNIDAGLNCYRKIREVGLSPDVVSHRTILHVLCERNMVREVETVIQDMEKSGVRVDEHSVPGVIKMYITEGKLDQAQLFYEKCQLNGELSSKTCAAIIDAYAEKGFWTEAEAVFYRKKDLVRQKKNVLEYNVMIKAYGKAKLYDKAFSLFKGMRNHGTWPDNCTYNSLIQMDVLTEMREMGFKPHSLAFSSLIGCCARLGQLSDAIDVVEEALKYFHHMEESGISANQIVLSSLLKAYGKVDSLDGAKVLYERLKDLEGARDIVASNSMIDLYADRGMVSEAELIFEKLRAKGWANEITYATMIYLYKSVGMLDEAIDIAGEMKLSGLVRDCGSFNKVMSCYAINGQLLECGELLHEMVTRKLLPDVGTFKVLFTILKKGVSIEAVTQLESSYHEGKPYSRQAVITTVFSMKLTKADVKLDSFLYNVAIYAYGAAGEIDKALNMFMRMQDEDLEPDVVTYINLVRCYGKAGMVEGLKRIYSRLKYEEPNHSLYKAVMDAYTDANRHDLAKLVSQEMRYEFYSEQKTGSETKDESDEATSDLDDV